MLKKLVVFFAVFLLGGCMEGQKKALIVVTNHSELGQTGKETGYFLSEVTHPYMILHRAGVQVDIASPKGGRAPMDPKSDNMDDPDNREFLETDEHAQKIQDTLTLPKVNAQDYDTIIFAGGHGTMWDFPQQQFIETATNAIYGNGGVVAAVCHGPSAFVGLKTPTGEGLIKGRNLTGFTNEEERTVELAEVVPFLLEDKLKQMGAEWSQADKFRENVVVDGRIVTGQNPASARGMGEKVLDLLQNQ